MKRDTCCGMGFVLVAVLLAAVLSGSSWASEADAWAGYRAGYKDGYYSGGANSRFSVTDYRAGYDAGVEDGRYAFYTTGTYGDFYGSSFPYDRFGETGQLAVVQRQITADLLTDYGNRRVVNNFRRLRLLKPELAAGDFIKNVAVRADFSFAAVDDDLLQGRGHDREAGVFGLVGLGDRLNLGLSYANDKYTIDTRGRDYEETVDAFDAILALDVTPQLTAGVFVNVSRVDIEDEVSWVNDGPGKRFDRYGAGLLASYNQPLGQGTDVGLTTAIASMNKHTLADLFDNEDTAWIAMLEANHQVFEWLSVGAYGSYLALLDRETSPTVKTPDGSYWTWGGDVSFRLRRHVKLAVGGSTIAADADRHEKRLNTALTVSF